MAIEAMDRQDDTKAELQLHVQGFAVSLQHWLKLIKQ